MKEFLTICFLVVLVRTGYEGYKNQLRLGGIQITNLRRKIGSFFLDQEAKDKIAKSEANVSGEMRLTVHFWYRLAAFVAYPFFKPDIKPITALVQAVIFAVLLFGSISFGPWFMRQVRGGRKPKKSETKQTPKVVTEKELEEGEKETPPVSSGP